jgi:hypothetical protein
MSILKKLLQYSVLCTICNVSLNALAHHGSVVNPNMYLAENLIEVEGEIVDVFWRAPHPRYRMSVIDESGEEAIWELELNGSPITYSRLGLGSDDIVKVGETIKAAGYVSKVDTSSMGVLHMLLTNGQEFVNGRTRELRWGNVRLTADTLDYDPIKIDAAKETAEGLFRVWGPVRSAELTEADYVHMFTDGGQQLASEYDPIADNFELDCRQGMPDTMFDRGAPMELTDLGDRILIHLEEYDIERIIHMNQENRRSFPAASDLGFSMGHWQGDDLIVETTGVDWPYYDEVGIPQSIEVSHHEQFSVSEDGNLLSYVLTITDPLVFSGPLVLATSREWDPGREVEEYGCTATWEE